jgi:polyisoprenoid-binding protein YceI
MSKHPAPLALATALGLGLLAATAPAPSALAQDERTIDAATAPAGTYTLDKAHSSVTMRVSHAGLSYATLRFDRFEGTLDYDPARPEQSKLQVSIDPASVDTGDPALDKLVASEILEAGQYPQIRFASTAVKPTIEGRGQVHGDLTFHGQTRPIDLDVLFNGAAQNSGGQGGDRATRLGFSANATVQRSAFGAAKYRPIAGDDVSIDIEVEFKK